MKIFSIVKVVLFNIILFAILLFISELAIRFLFPNMKLYRRTYPEQYSNHSFSPSSVKVNWAKEDSSLGWTCKQSNSIIFTNKFYNNPSTKYIINKQGFRNKFNFDSSFNPANKNRVMMLGDSFLFGVYLQEHNIISNILDSLCNSSVYIFNLGIPGFGIDQMYLSYQKYQRFLHPKLVILFYIDDDIQRVYEAYRLTEGMNKPSFGIVNNELVLRTPSNPNLIEKIFGHSYLLNKIYKRFAENESHRLTENIFIELIKLTKQNNQKLFVLRCPTKEQVTNKNDFSRYSFMKLFKNYNVPYYELHDVFNKYPKDEWSKFYLKYDGHLSAKGNQIVANFIFNEIILKNVNL